MYLRYAMMCVAALAGCGVKSPPPPESVAAPTAERPAPAALPLKPVEAAALTPAGMRRQSDKRFPLPGTPYPEARAKLLAEGFEPAPDRITDPLPGYPDIECFQNGICWALFTELKADGWRDYVLAYVEKGDPPKVREVRFGAAIEGVLSIPPEPAPDIPKLPAFYALARVQLMGLGYRPVVNTYAPPHDGCIRLRGNECEATAPMTEVDCSGTGVSFCGGYWRAPDGRTLKVTTVGEPTPRRIYYLEWVNSRTGEGAFGGRIP